LKLFVLATTSFFTGMGLNLLMISVLAGGPEEIQLIAGLGTMINSFVAFTTYGALREEQINKNT